MTKFSTVHRFIISVFLVAASLAASAQNTPPIVNNDVNTTAEDAFVTGNILIGDIDPDGTTLTANTALVKAPSHGTLFLQANGNYSYIPAANFNGVDTAIISVCDAGTPLPAICVNDTLIITVTPVNDAPVALNDTGSVIYGNTVAGNLTGNDSDIDGPSANYTLASVPAHGNAVVNSNGTYSYTPTGFFGGRDTFSYSYCDGGTPDLCDTALVVITVTVPNFPPNAVNDTLAGSEDSPITGNVGTNDTDVDGPGAIYGLDVPPSHGTVSLSVNGDYTYRPSAEYSGTDSFTYVHCDGGNPNLCDTATVYINLAIVNDAPVANDDNNTTPMDTVVSGDVSLNDSDVDGPGATYSVVTRANHGSLVLAANGTYTYTSDTGYAGCDTMVVSRCDGGTPNRCDSSLLVICVTSGLIATDDVLAAQSGVPVSINVLTNDAGLNGPTVTIISAPSHGTADVNPDTTITYTAATGYTGADAFTYIVCNSGNPVICDTATVFVSVSGVLRLTTAPIVTTVDSAVVTCYSYTLSSDTTSVTATFTCAATHGGTAIAIDSASHQVCISYAPDTAYIGSDSVCITLCETATGSCTTSVVPISVNALVTTCYWIKGISPNGDGQNDAFYVNCNDQYPAASLKVFNRWGDQVWDSNGHYTNNWDAKNGRGEVLPDGTYYYIYVYNDGTKGQHAGFIQVNR